MRNDDRYKLYARFMRLIKHDVLQYGRYVDAGVDPHGWAFVRNDVEVGIGHHRYVIERPHVDQVGVPVLLAFPEQAIGVKVARGTVEWPDAPSPGYRGPSFCAIIETRDVVPLSPTKRSPAGPQELDRPTVNPWYGLGCPECEHAERAHIYLDEARRGCCHCDCGQLPIAEEGAAGFTWLSYGDDGPWWERLATLVNRFEAVVQDLEFEYERRHEERRAREQAARRREIERARRIAGAQ